MKFIRKSLNIVFVSVVVIVLAVTAICMFVDPNRLKPVITTQVSQQTGYQLDIDGDFSWSFYPRVGIKVDAIKITAPQQKAPFISMNDVTLGMDLLQLLRGKSKLSGDIHIKQLTLMNLQAKNLTADMEWENNILTISPMSAMLYDGWMSGTIHGRELNKVPHWDWDVQFSRVQLKSLLRDLNGKDTKLTVDGLGQLRMQAETSGMNKAEMLNHMLGNVAFSLTNGSVSGFDLNYLISTAVELINKQPITAPSNNMETAFESLTGTMKIKHTIASTDNTILVASAFTVKALGSMDLSRQVIDYSLNIVPQHLEQFKWSIPVLVTGDLQSPTVKLDMLKINTIIANEQFQKIKEKAQEKLKKLPKQVDNFLQKMFGGNEQ